jgi:ABC-type transporter Mla subunit MlaD
MFKNAMKIKDKLLFVFLSLTILTVLVTSLISFGSIVNPLRKNVIEHMKSCTTQFHAFMDENPDMDWAVVKKICNEKITIGKTGFLFVVDPKGNLLIHKKAEGKNWSAKPHIKKIIETRNGVLRYLSPVTKTYKVAAFEYLKDRDWIIVASAFEDDFVSTFRSGMIKYSTIAGVIIIILASIVIYLFSLHLVRPIKLIITGLNEGVDQFTSSSGQISSSSQSLAEGASEQASSLEETSSSLEEMASMTKQNADNANQADTLMKEANQTVAKANTSMGELTTSMDEISKASEETQKIIKTIDEIAFQTNLLALNAAVEAARAGEAGAGFAVVADEVRNLAMRSADAAKGTAGLIEGTVKKIKDGSDLVTTTNEAFTEVATSASKVGELVGEIAAASNEQAQGIDQVNKAVAEMDKVIQQNSANAEESASASEEMSAQAKQMKGVVGDLIALVGGSAREGKSSEYTENRKGAAAQRPGIETHQTYSAPVTKGKETSEIPQKAGNAHPDQVIPMDEGDFKDF